MRRVVLAALLTWAVALVAAPRDTAVRVWRGTVTIPTYEEGPPNPNPPFDLFSWGRFNYPYTIRDRLTNRRVDVVWRSLHLENEYLRLTVLPDLGGRIYRCLDKRTSREMFYANPSIKKALIGYRGAWSAFGVEFNFPVSHNWVSMSPVDFATQQYPDGSGSIWVGNTDQVYGGQWRVELRLAPGRTVLEQHVELSNPGDVRHRYYWWSNAAVQVWDDSQLVYPTEVMSTHGFTRIEPWPIDPEGRDLSVIRNQTAGPVSLFTYATREGFVGVYHPKTASGTVHVTSPADLPVHKIWSWGADRDGMAWREALSDNDSAYVELQAGLFRNQETYAFLEPQEAVRFSEYWLPVRDVGGITRASEGAVLAMTRTAATGVRLALDVTRDLPGARIVVRHGSTTAIDLRVALTPNAVWRQDLRDVPVGTPVTFELTDDSGAIVLTHTEGVFDRTPASKVRLGPPLEPPAADEVAPSASTIGERGMIDELEGRRLAALTAYRDGVARYPASALLLKAAGRLALALGWVESGDDSVTTWLSAAYAANTTDAELRYYLGVALAAAGRAGEGREHLEAAQRFRATRTQALVQRVRIAAREGQLEAALQLVQTLADDAPRVSLAGALEVSLLRRLGRQAEARLRALYWLRVDPASSLLRYEATLLGEQDEELWTHLGADANRVLDLVDHYLAIGGFADALALLGRSYPPVGAPMREVGAVAPGESPLVAYYRGYAREQTGHSGMEDYRLAEALPTAYVFPARRSSYAVLHAALRTSPGLAHARYFLGALYLSGGQTQRAIEAWQPARPAQPAIPTLHRSLGLALVHGRADITGARAVLEEGLSADRENVEIYLALDQVLSALGASARDRVAALRRFPAPADMPGALAFKLAWALAEAGEPQAAEGVFHDRFFPREEGGTSVRSAYAQTRLISAQVASELGRCDQALGLLDSLAAEQQGLEFTTGGLGDLLDQPVLAQQASAVEWTCGRRAQARARSERIAGLAARGGPVTVAMAYAAARHLGMPGPADRTRLRRALADASRALSTGTAGNPGLLECARGLLLRALGRDVESRQSLRQVFLFPDRDLSHALARAALHDAVVARGRHRADDSRSDR